MRFLVQLSGISKKKPKALQAHQRWSKDHFDAVVRPDFEKKCNDEGIKGKEMVSVCEQITREHFLATDEEMQARYAQLAKDETRTAIEEWMKVLSAPPASDPASCQA